MLPVLLAGLATGAAIAVPVGAVGALIVGLSARTSWRVGAAAGLGVATVDGGYALVAVSAGGAVAAALEPVAPVLEVVSIVVLLGIAALTLAHALRPEQVRDASGGSWTPRRAWAAFAGITAVNPATVLYFSAIVIGGTVDLDGPAEGALFVVAAFTASAGWQVFVATVGAVLGTWIAGPRGRRITGVVAAVAIAGLALKPLW